MEKYISYKQAIIRLSDCDEISIEKTAKVLHILFKVDETVAINNLTKTRQAFQMGDAQ